MKYHQTCLEKAIKVRHKSILCRHVGFIRVSRELKTWRFYTGFAEAGLTKLKQLYQNDM